jgi:hypothetical protein
MITIAIKIRIAHLVEVATTSLKLVEAATKTGVSTRPLHAHQLAKLSA